MKSPAKKKKSPSQTGTEFSTGDILLLLIRKPPYLAKPTVNRRKPFQEVVVEENSTFLRHF
jgi:hypothetical protein